MKTVSEPPNSAAKPKMSRWFWGTLFVLFCASFLLTILVGFREEAGAQADDEMSPLALNTVLTEANVVALRKITKEIDPLLEAAYQPVYDAIEAYTDFHYSLEGEYTELSLGALGKLSGAIQARLFSGLETRLGGVATQLDRRFEEKFREQLEAGFAEGDALGPLTRSVKTNAEIRVGVSGAVFAGGALSVKAASMLIAKKLGAKIAIKAAAKAGAKWAVVATGAGGGALACSWAGPVAAICGAGGAVVAWVATDVAVIKLDELMTRDEFEANLQALIDEDKGARRAQLEAALTAKAQTVQVGSDKAVQDFNLKQLSGGASDEVCSTADFLVTQYGIYRDDVRERNPDSLTAFQANFSVYKKDLSLRPLVLEIEENLGPVGLRFTVSGIAIRGNLPSDYRTNGDISGRIALNGQTVEFERLSATSDDGFDLRSSSPTELRDISLTKFEVALEQHRRVFTNRLFGGAITRDLFDAMPETKGLEHGLTLLVPIEIDEEAESIREVNARPASGNIVAVDLTVRGEPLPELQYLLNCDR